MILYNKDRITGARSRPQKTLNMEIEERPERPTYDITKDRDRVKFIRTIETVVRKSTEYKEYIKFLKTYMDMSRCAVLKGLSVDNGKRYTIEIHHEPFSLFSITDTVIRKWESLGKPLNPLLIAEEIMELHYDEKVGLIPLSKTMHELVGNDKIFIPLQFIYHKYNEFYDEYSEYMSDKYKEMIQAKVNLSLKTNDILSDVLDTEFIYVHIDGFVFPEIPKEWEHILKSEQTEEE